MRAGLRLLGLALVVAGAPARAAVDGDVPPAPTRWVTDEAGFLAPATRAALDAKLEGYERQSGHQVVVWIGRTIGGAALDDWANRTFKAWGLGQKGKDDGLALFILADDHKIAIEVGYGLEGQVTDALSSRIISEIMAPRIRAGQADEAVARAVDGLLEAIEGRPVGDLGPAPPPPQTEPSGRSLGEKLFGGLLLLAFIIFFITNPRLALLFMWSAFSGRGGGGFGGGGGGGGGFHGGGGRSGGGGARGGW